jgi:hypothetical protein
MCNSGSYDVEVYVTPNTSVGDGTPQAGEGARYLFTVTNQSGGVFNGSITLPNGASVTSGSQISTIAINRGNNNTSEFSANVPLTCVYSATMTATSNGPVCLGDTIRLGTISAATYIWTGPNSFSSSSRNPVIANATTAMAGVYNVTISESANCTLTASVTLALNPGVTNAAVTLSCNPTRLVASASTSTGTVSYLWNTGSASPTLNLTQPGTYTVTATNTAGCTARVTRVVRIDACTENCTNNTDDDLDGLLDCNDPDCKTQIIRPVLGN